MKMKFQQTALNMVMFLALGVGVTACGGGDGSSGESQTGWAESYNKAMSQRKLNSEGYKNTQKLNEKQKDFLLKVMNHGRNLSQIMELCYQKERDLNKCHDEKKGSSGKVSFGMNILVRGNRSSGKSETDSPEHWKPPNVSLLA